MGRHPKKPKAGQNAIRVLVDRQTAIALDEAAHRLTQEMGLTATRSDVIRRAIASYLPMKET